MSLKVSKSFITFGTAVLLMLFTACEPEDGPLVTGAPDTPIAAPRLFASYTQGELTLTWGWFNAGTATPERFRLLRGFAQDGRSDVPNFTTESSIAGELTSWTPEDIPQGRPVFFQLEAIGTDEQTAFSNLIMVTRVPKLGRKTFVQSPESDFSHGDVSANGQWLAYEAHTSAGTTEIQIRSGDRPVAYQFAGDDPQWHPQDLLLIYRHEASGALLADDDVTSHLTFFSPDQTRILPEIIGGDADYQFPCWAPDGASIAYISNLTQTGNYALFTYRLSDQQISKPLTEGLSQTELPFTLLEKAPQRIKWHPQGQWLAFDQLNQQIEGTQLRVHRDILFFDIETETLRMEEGSSWDDHSPVFSPSGNEMAFLSDRSGLYEIWLKNLSTGELRMLTGNGLDAPFMSESGGLSWSKNGTEILYTGLDDTGNKGIYSLSLQ
ncbi:MAG: hypothetical protein AAFR59_13415 [Bacteroidota bacterium]